MADLFEKKRPTSYGTFSAPDVGRSSLGNLYKTEPLSVRYENPCHTAKDLVRYLLACQMERYGQVIDLPIESLMANAKRLLKKYHINIVARAVRFAAFHAAYPYSFSFVEKKAIPEVMKRCHFLTEYQTLLNNPSEKNEGKR